MICRLKELPLPCTDQVKDLMLEAFEKAILPLNENEKERMIAEVIKTKPVIRSREQLKEDIMKFISIKEVSANSNVFCI